VGVSGEEGLARIELQLGASHSQLEAEGLAELALTLWSQGLERSTPGLEARVESRRTVLSLRAPLDELEEELLALLGRIGPDAVDAEQFASDRAKLVAARAAQHSSASGRAQRLAVRLSLGHDSHSYRTQATADHLAAHELDALEDWLTSHLSRARLRVGLVGLPDSEELTRRVDAALAALPAEDQAEPLRISSFLLPERALAYCLDGPELESTHVSLRMAGPGANTGEEAALRLWMEAVMGGESALLAAGLPPEASSSLALVLQPESVRQSSVCIDFSAPPAQADVALAQLLENVHSLLSDLPNPALRAARERLVASETEPSEEQRLARALEAHSGVRGAQASQVALSVWQDLREDSLLVAAQTLLNPLGRIVVGVGADVSSRLERVLPVQPVRWEDAPLRTPEARAEVDQLLEAMGGQEGWGQLTALRLSSRCDYEVARPNTEPVSTHFRMIQWISMQDARSRTDQIQFGVTTTNVVAEGRAWMRSSQGITDLGGQLQTLALRRMQRTLYRMVHQLALDVDLSYELDERGRLQLGTEHGTLAWLELDADTHLPRRLYWPTDQGEQFIDYLEWMEHESLLYPARWRFEGGTVANWSNQEIEPLSAIDEELLRDPRLQ